MTMTTAVRAASRRGAGVLSLLAVGALLVGCSTGGPSDAEEAPTEPAVTEPAASDGGQGDGATTGEATDAGQDDAGSTSSAQGEETPANEGGADGEDQAGSGESPDPAEVQAVIDSWSGTLSADTLPSTDGVPYIAFQELYELGGKEELTSAEIEGTEYLGSHSASCEGAAVLGGDPVTCTFTEADGPAAGTERTASVFRTSTALLIAAGEGSAPEVVLDPDAGLLFGQALPDSGEVTAESLEAALINAGRLVEREDGEVTDQAEASCELRDGVAHATCTLTGLPEGVSGYWYATVQPGPAGVEGASWYLFTRFPE